MADAKIATTTLKPCPFCGGDAGVEYIPEWGWAKYEVSCHICGATANAAFFTEEDAVRWWNRRADNGA